MKWALPEHHRALVQAAKAETVETFLDTLAAKRGGYAMAKPGTFTVERVHKCDYPGFNPVAIASDGEELYAHTVFKLWRSDADGGVAEVLASKAARAYVKSLVVRDGVVWIGHPGGIKRATEGGETTEDVQVDKIPILGLAFGPDGSLWAGGGYSDKGAVYVKPPKGKAFRRVQGPTAEVTSVSATQYGVLVGDFKGGLWLGKEGTLEPIASAATATRARPGRRRLDASVHFGSTRGLDQREGFEPSQVGRIRGALGDLGARLRLDRNNALRVARRERVQDSTDCRRRSANELEVPAGKHGGVLVPRWRHGAGLIPDGFHAAREPGAFATARVDDDDFRVGAGVPFDETGELLGVVPLVEQVAADDEVVARQRGGFVGPTAPGKGKRSDAVEPTVEVQERLALGMVVGRGDVDLALVQHEARESDAAAHFEDATTADVELDHQTGKGLAGVPDDAEERPVGGQDPEVTCLAVVVRVLLSITQRSNVNVELAEFVGLVADP